MRRKRLRRNKSYSLSTISKESKTGSKLLLKKGRKSLVLSNLIFELISTKCSKVLLTYNDSLYMLIKPIIFQFLGMSDSFFM
jgi:hypothetical protein